MHVIILTLQLVVGQGAVAMRDSAGVRIIENDGYQLADSESWHLAPTPSLRMGVQMGATEYEFFRISGLVRLRNDHIVVADAGSSHLMFFDGAGDALTVTGREGGGPGEFSEGAPTALWRWSNDSLATWDLRFGRLQIYGADGQLGRTLPLQRPPLTNANGVPNPGAYPHAIGISNDGGLAVRFFRGRPRPSRETVGKVYRDSTRFGWYDEGGRYVGDGPTLPWSDWLFFAWDNGLSSDTLPFGVRAAATMSRGSLIYMPGHLPAYEVRNVTGVVTQIVRVRGERARLPREAVDRYKDQRMAFAPAGQERMWRRWLDTQIRFPEYVPVFDRVLADQAGNVRVKVYTVETEQPSMWLVFDTGGRLLCPVEMPARFTAMEVGEDYVLGVWRDALDAEHVDLYELVKGSSSSRSNRPVDPQASRSKGSN